MKGVLQCYGNKPNLLETTRIKATESNNNNNKKKRVSEIRVCTNKPCRRQSSMEILHTLSAISPPDVSVTSCGCLGSCGMGPNLVLLPGPTRIKHCSTPARAARTLFDQVVDGNSTGCFDPELWINNSLAGVAFRKRADALLAADLCQAEKLLSQAINLKPCGGIHHLYKARSAARLMMGNITGALEDAQEAITLSPKYTEAYICQADALMATHQFESAEKSYAMAVELDPSIFRSKSFKARIAKLREKLVQADSQ